MGVAAGTPARAALRPRPGWTAASRARLSREGALQIEVGERELVLPGKARGHGELDPPDTLLHSIDSFVDSMDSALHLIDSALETIEEHVKGE